MEPENQVEMIAGEPLMSYEADFADYEATGKPAPMREVKPGLNGVPLEGKISRIAAALALLEACQDDADEAQSALDAAIRIKDGSLQELAAASAPDATQR
jgi:hypothetical protein